MKIVFRVNYHTHPGQTIWLKLVALFTSSGVRVAEVIPLHWLNAEQWEGAVELDGSGTFRLEYHYQLRQEGNGAVVDEWLAPRVTQVDPAVRDVVVALDTWCSAGTMDHVYETAAFAVLLPNRGPLKEPAVRRDANHEFRLRMAAVPPGQVPCLLGSGRELGEWNRELALPLAEVAANVWQVAVSLPAEAHLEYKYGLWDLATARVASLEQGPNRVLAHHAYGPRQWTRVSDEAYARDASERFRGCGVAVPVFSLRSAAGLGVGEFADLKPLADWAAAAGLRMIQILPVNDTTAAGDWTDSYPYSAISVFALHPLYLRLEDLPYPMPPEFITELAAAREALNLLSEVDYEAVMRVKRRLTRQVYDRHQATLLADREFRRFYQANRAWLLPYAAFCCLRDRHESADFSSWGDWAVYEQERVEGLVSEAGEAWPEVAYHLWLQFELDRQLADAVRHLHERGIVLKGDLPIGIDRHSVDAWSLPHLFKLASQTGAPPDAFAIKGQNWGFPTYDWAAMKTDGYAWWRTRFAHLGRYFDAFRIDHILGFFRIWQIPTDQVEGIMGWFDPALPIHVDELRARGIPFDFNRYCRPYIREHSLVERFGTEVDRVCRDYLEPCGFGYWKLREVVATQRQIVEALTAATAPGAPERERHLAVRQALLDCASEVLLLEEPGSQGTQFHPRCLLQLTRSFEELDPDVKWRLAELHDDYFYRQQEDFWQARGYETLPAMRQASSMLLCGEDLGMVPDCVPGVLAQLGILSLDIQRMPKNPQSEFFHPAAAPYLSVVSPSTHDMSPLREWWREDGKVTSDFAWSMLGLAFPPLELTGETAGRIIAQHLASPAMWAVFPMQDLLAMDETLRHPDPAAERINVPAITPYYWRYRMHLGVEQLGAADEFNAQLQAMIVGSGR